MSEKIQDFNYGLIEDPRIFAEGRLSARAAFEAYPNQETYADGASHGTNPLRVSLNGLWKFHYALNLGQLIDGCMEDSYDCAEWGSIRVPGHIQLQGHGIPQYVNTMYPWDGHEELAVGEVPQMFNPVGTYVRYFDLPQGWTDDQVLIRFNGVESAYALWLNGTYIGYATDTFTPSEFDLSSALREGENKLTVQVFRFSASSWAEDQDFFRFSGIYRDVELLRVPSTSLWDYTIRTDLNEDFTVAKVRFLPIIQAPVEEAATLKLRLLDIDNEIIAEVEGDVETTELIIDVDNPLLWSAEHPNLYGLEIELVDGAGTTVSYHVETVGIRRFEMVDGIMEINGKRIVFNGVNRHDFSAEHGRSVIMSDIIQDLIHMKQNNINSIRTSHYPSRHELYRLADELGFYVIAENNLESHGTWQDPSLTDPIANAIPGDRDDWRAMMLDRIDSTYHRDKNRPSVIIWSVGNESYGGSVILDMANRFRELDDTRLVHYEGIFHDRRYNDSSDMESHMYTPVEGIRSFLAAHPEKPFIICEFTHAMGNSVGGMHKYTDYADEEPRYQGGFIWDYIDQTLWTKDRYGEDYLAYGGDFGERPHDGNFSGDGILFGDHSLTPKMQEVKANYQPLVIKGNEEGFSVYNRALFTNSAEYFCEISLTCEGELLEYEVIHTDVEPGETKTFAWPFEKRTVAGEYVLEVDFVLAENQVWAEAGHSIAFGQAAYVVTGDEGGQAPKNTRADHTLHELTTSRDLIISDGLNTIGVKGLDFEALFADDMRGLVSYNYGGVELLEDVVTPNFWRAPTDNDRGYGMEQKAGFWKLASLYSTITRPTVERLENGDVTVTYVYTYSGSPEIKCDVVYTVSRNGTIRVDQTMDATGVNKLLPEFSMIFKVKADYDNFTWYGLGPDETYADRKRGGRLGVYSSTVGENFANYPRPQESGAHQHVRWARVTNSQGRGLLFTSNPDGRTFVDEQGEEITSEIKGGLSFSALHYSPHEIENARHHYELPNVHYTYIRAASEQLGVGGDDSWGAQVHPEYRLDTTKPLRNSFSFRGVV